MSILHSKPPLLEHCSADDRIVLKSGDSRDKTNADRDTTNAVSHGDDRGESPYVQNRTYLATQPAQENNISLHLGSELPGIDYTQNKSPGHSSEGRPGDALASVINAPPLLVQCDDCRGCGQLTNDHANDPWARAWTCSMCDGTGEVIAGCACCQEDATERFDGLLLCELCAAEQRADALLESAP